MSDVYDHSVKPSREGLEPHQVWVWLAGATPPRWEIRGTGAVACDPMKPSDLSPVPHDYQVTGEDYGSLADGGSYEILTCRRCGRVAYSPLPD